MARHYRENPNAFFKQDLFDLANLFIKALMICTIMFSFFAFGVKVCHSSMEPTLKNDEYLLCYKFMYTPQRGDIVIINHPNSFDKDIVKRVIAKENDEISIDFKSGDIFVNGQLLHEPYIQNQVTRKSDLEFPLVVPKGKYFVMGDNRSNSLDSRSSIIGFIDKKDIFGKAIVTLLPLNRFHILK